VSAEKLLDIKLKLADLYDVVNDEYDINNPLIAREVYDKLDRELLKTTTDANVKSNKKSVNTNLSSALGVGKVAESIDKKLYKDEIDARQKLYTTYREVLRYFPQLANALRITAEIVTKPENDAIIDSYFVDKKIENKTLENISELEENELTQDTVYMQKFSDKYKLPKKVFEKALSIMREGDYFVEIINSSSIKNVVKPKTKELDTIFISESYLSKEFKVGDSTIFEAVDNNSLSKELNEYINEFKVNDFDAETEFLVENATTKKLEESSGQDEFDSIIIRKHKPEHVVKLVVGDMVFGYVVVTPENREISSDSIQAQFEKFTKIKDVNRGSKMTAISKLNNAVSASLLSNIASKISNSNGATIEKIINSSKEIKTIVNLLINDNKTGTFRFVPETHMVHYMVSPIVEHEDKYGESFLYTLLPDIKNYIKLKQAYANYLVNQSKDKQKIIITVDQSTSDVESAINATIKEFKDREIAAMDDIANVDGINRDESPFDRYYLPKINGETPIEFDTVPAVNMNVDENALKIYSNDIIAGIRVPSSLLDSAEASYKYAMTQESSAYATTIMLLQDIISEGDTEILNKVRKITGETKINNLRYKLRAPTALFNEAKEVAIGQVRTIIDFVYEMYVDPTADVQLGYMKKRSVAKEIYPQMDWAKFDKLFNSDSTEKDINDKTKPEVQQPQNQGGF
jgi:hypothetical protein